MSKICTMCESCKKQVDDVYTVTASITKDATLNSCYRYVDSFESKNICLDCAKCYFSHFENAIDIRLKTTEDFLIDDDYIEPASLDELLEKHYGNNKTKKE